MVELGREYGELIAKMASGVIVDADRLKAGTKVEPIQFSINELCLAFIRHPPIAA
jgi:hypothetical protein